MADQTSDDRPPIYAACLDCDGARALFTKLYGWTIDVIKELQGYDDRNFYIKSSNEPSENNEFVLKIVNSRDSSNFDLMQAQTNVLLYLSKCGIVCPTPVKNLSGKYCCLEEILDKTGKQPAGLKFMVRLMVFIPGKLVRDHYQPNTPGVPDKWFYALGRRLATINMALLDFQNSLAIASLKKQADDFIWSPSCCLMVRKICWAVKDEEKRKLAEAILGAFESDIVPRMAKERKCIIHTDYNDMNIISRIEQSPPDDNTTRHQTDWHTAGGVDISASQDTRLEVVGLIDFSDIVYTNLMFDVGNSMAYMMMSQTLGDPLVSGGHFLAGYNSVLPLTPTEMNLIRVCTCSRLVQSLVNGLHAFTLDPSNEYVLDTQKTGWSVLNQLWRKPNEELIAMWGDIDKLYCSPINKFSSSPKPNHLEITASPNSPCIIQKPFLKSKTAVMLLEKLYGFRPSDIKNIKELLSYSDQNFYVRVRRDGETETEKDQEFVLKLINSNDSKERGSFEMQISTLQFLRVKGFSCASPVQNVKGKYLSLEKILKADVDESVGDGNGYGLFLTFLLTFVPGQMMSNVDPVSDQLHFNAGVYLAKLDQLLLDFPGIPESFKSRASNLEWSIECLSWIRPFMVEIEDPDRRQLVESILDTFDKEVVPKIKTLRKCIIHNDFNDYNILVMEKTPPSKLDKNCTSSSPTAAKKMKPHPEYDITGVIDFSDMIYTCLLFEVCTSLSFMMYTNTDNPTAATAYFLAGFQSIIPLTAEEMSLLYLCMVARMSQELVLGLRNYRLQPGNEYILITQEKGWKFLQELWGDPGAQGRVEKLWKTIADTCKDRL
ncbi:uncharacterized protein [Asterias amurensis]|uniref:uncharacterized protein n=1 Tax=Asterias amurensis TaxID=7602 RepID=UPI003AB16536